MNILGEFAPTKVGDENGGVRGERGEPFFGDFHVSGGDFQADIGEQVGGDGDDSGAFGGGFAGAREEHFQVIPNQLAGEFQPVGVGFGRCGGGFFGFSDGVGEPGAVEHGDDGGGAVVGALVQVGGADFAQDLAEIAANV